MVTTILLAHLPRFVLGLDDLAPCKARGDRSADSCTEPDDFGGSLKEIKGAVPRG